MDRRNFLKTSATGLAAMAAMGPPRRAGAGDRFRWRMVTAWPPGFPVLQTGAERFAKRVGELSSGRLTIQVFAGGELVPPLGVFDAVSGGAAQCGHSAAYYWAGKSVASQWFTSVPFGLNAQGMNSWLLSGGGLQLWEEIYAPFQLVPRPCGNTGVQMGGWFNREIRTLDDFKGLKMRIPGLGGKVLARAGGSVVLLPAAEIYTSLERGVIDASEWVGPAHDLRMGFHKVAKYYYGPGWHEPGSVLEVIFNKKAWEELPPELQAVLDVAAAESNLAILAEFEVENGRALAALQAEKRVQIRAFPDQVLAELKKLAAATLEEVAASDPVAAKVHGAFTKFRAGQRSWSVLSEGAYYGTIG